MKYRIVAIGGEGIGLEVVEAALTVLKAVAQKHNFTVESDRGIIGKPALEQSGSYFPEATAQLCNGADGIVFGAVNKGGLLELRQRFDFLANLRPVKTHPCLLDKSSIRRDRLSRVDILFVRELVSGIYFGKSARGDDYGYHTIVLCKYYAKEQIKRIAEVALQQAQQRRKLLTVAHQENA